MILLRTSILKPNANPCRVVIQTKSTSETIRLGKRIGAHLQPGDVVALAGELGTGKTQFIKGVAAGVGVGKSTYITSPSFTLIHEYPGKIPFCHIDLYRLKTEREVEELGLEEYFQRGGVTAIEWADKISSLLPKEMLWIHIYYTGEYTRSLKILGKGTRYLNLVDQIQSSEFGARSSEQKA
jgi:tRNA threonylcarbamoyladenosine biosynthesis protein TsaE